MRISSPAHTLAALFAATLLANAPLARAGTFSVQPTFDNKDEASDSTRAAGEETPAHDWSNFGGDEVIVTPKPQLHEAMPAHEGYHPTASLPDESLELDPNAPPSFGDLDFVIPAGAREDIAESWRRWAPRI